jgi:hypothetical protein
MQTAALDHDQEDVLLPPLPSDSDGDEDGIKAAEGLEEGD